MPQKSSPPQLQDQDLYSKLREKGDSKEKAARISNAAANRGRSSVGKSGGQSPPYEDWTVKDLKNRAKELDLHNYSQLHKEELIDLLRHH
ncbi:Rho termination factor [Rhodococcus sp. ARC_M6]|uniref:DUF7218 family protein n=1 Tax=Rhodococcus sp. ARC_M6 TaxID=2928852 RepID=UPI001FB25F84|nr:Rho termination factor [Rhodococcus sp. ARC_M6]MCJ0905902.1 Rho termination factor [Rhodococcus sp. ARC_M6]